MAKPTNAQKQQIVGYLRDAGFTGDDLVTATAIVLRESKGNPQAFNGNAKTGDESYGLFQLNAKGALWSRFQKMGLSDKSQLLDPATNARAAFALYQQGGFRPWLGYRPGLTVAPQQAEAQALVQASGGGLGHGPGQSAVPLAKGQKMATSTGGLTGQQNGRIPDNMLTAIPGGRLETNAAQAYLRMVAAAQAQGVQIGVTDSYRTYDQQVALVKAKGQYTSTHRSGGAAPGTSEHGWGQAIDVTNAPGAQAWLAQHAGEYGFKANAPGEPWHFGYVGPGSMSTTGRKGSPSIAAAHGDAHGTGSSPGDSTAYAIDSGMGWMAGLLQDPEVANVLHDAAATNATPAQLQAALMNTNWWQTHQASVREFDGNMATDPATVNAQVTSKMAELQAQAAKLGYVVDPGHLRDLATAALRLNMNDAEVANAIGAEAARDGTLGNSGTHQNVRQMAADFGVPQSDMTLDQWTQNIATGQSTAEQYREYLVGAAKGLFPGFADGLDRGLTVRQLADPYVQTAAQNLGIDPDTISLNDPKWSGAIMGTDPKTGGKRTLGLDEFTTKIRSDPTYGWQNTNAARDQAYGFAAQLSKLFGRSA